MTTSPSLWRGPITDNATDNGFQQDSGVVATTAADTFDAVWRDSGNFNSGHSAIVGRAFDKLGNPTGGDVVLNPLNNAFGIPFNASQPAATRLPITGQSDGLAVAFTDNFNNGPDFDVYVVRTNASLSRLENPLLIDGSTSVTNDPSVTSFADGGLVVSYTIQNSTTDWDVLARTVSPTGVVGPVITLFNDTDRSDLSDLATLKNGNFVAVFESQFLASPTDLDSFFTIKTENGTTVVAPTTVAGAGSTATETNPHVAALTGGGFVVTWTDSAGDMNGTSQGIRATIYDANGNVINGGGNILVNQFNQAGTQLSNDVTALPDGGFEVAWEDVSAGVDRVQRFDSAGNLLGTPTTVSNLATFDINAAALADGRSIATVNDFSSGNNNTVSTILDTRPPIRDFNADRMSDLLFQNTDGTPGIWEMSGLNVIGAGVPDLPNPGPSWHLVGTGDVNGDGTSDLLFQNTDGTPGIWEMSGLNVIGAGITPLGNPGPSWHLVGAGDFNADGNSDLLFQNTDGTPAIWEMNGLNVIGAGVPDLPNPGPSWHVIGTGDFNGDGHSDILFQNTDGTPAIWEMSGLNVIGAGVPDLPNPGPSWHLIGAGDVNGDGMSDLVFQNTDGTPAIWEMNGLNVIGAGITNLGNPGPSFQLIGTGDVNGDRNSDLVFQNTDGTPAIWEMNGLNVIGAGTTDLGNPGPSWHLLPRL